MAQNGAFTGDDWMRIAIANRAVAARRQVDPGREFFVFFIAFNRRLGHRNGPRNIICDANRLWFIKRKWLKRNGSRGD
jgi:hypothetical protein